jgi:hypothetical protein
MINYFNFTSEISWKGYGGFHKWTKVKYGQRIRTLKTTQILLIITRFADEF